MTSLVASEEVTGEPVDSTPEVTGGQEPLMGPCGTQSEDQERFEFFTGRGKLHFKLSVLCLLCVEKKKWDVPKRTKLVLGDQTVGEAQREVISYHWNRASKRGKRSLLEKIIF